MVETLLSFIVLLSRCLFIAFFFFFSLSLSLLSRKKPTQKKETNWSWVKFLQSQECGKIKKIIFVTNLFAQIIVSQPFTLQGKLFFMWTPHIGKSLFQSLYNVNICFLLIYYIVTLNGVFLHACLMIICICGKVICIGIFKDILLQIR